MHTPVFISQYGDLSSFQLRRLWVGCPLFSLRLQGHLWSWVVEVQPLQLPHCPDLLFPAGEVKQPPLTSQHCTAAHSHFPPSRQCNGMENRAEWGSFTT